MRSQFWQWLRGASGQIARLFRIAPRPPMEVQVTVTAPITSAGIAVRVVGTAAFAATILIQPSPSVADAAAAMSPPPAGAAATVAPMMSQRPIPPAAPTPGPSTPGGAVGTAPTPTSKASTRNTASPKADAVTVRSPSPAAVPAVSPARAGVSVARTAPSVAKEIRGTPTAAVSDPRNSTKWVDWIILFALLAGMMAINHTPGGSMVWEFLRSTGAFSLLDRAAAMALNRICGRWPRLRPVANFIRRVARLPVTHEIGQEVTKAARRWFDDLWEWVKPFFSPFYSTVVSPSS